MLSLCIPTYNRAEILEGCLESIVEQEMFDYRTEIVISDNCSTDHTEEVCRKYAKKYNNIRYFRNEQNIKDQNFALSIQRAEGLLRKLTNDTTRYRAGALKFLLEAVSSNSNEQPLLFFLSNKLRNDTIIEAKSLDGLINCTGIGITWINSIALWADDCEDLTIFHNEAYTNMAQVPFLFSCFERHSKALIYEKKIMDITDVPNKNLTYGLFHVFHDNLLQYMQQALNERKISQECYDRFRKRILLDFFALWTVNQEIKKNCYQFSNENLKELVKEAYGKEKYYWKYLFKRELIRIKTLGFTLITRGRTNDTEKH